MWRRRPVRTCNSPTLVSTITAFPGNLYRSGLGVGMSPSIKKSIQMIYRPGVGHQQTICCIKAPFVPPLVFQVLDGGTPRGSGPVIIDGNYLSVSYDGGKP